MGRGSVWYMRAPWILLLTPVAAHAMALDLEIAPGIAWSTDIPAAAPVMRGRVGFEFPWFTPSIAAVGAFLTDPGPPAHQGQRGGLTGWGVAAEARFHTEGEYRFVAGVGVGWGQLSTLQQANGDTEGYHGKPAPYVEAVVGYQWAGSDFRAGVVLTLDFFNRVNLEGDLSDRFCADGYPIGPYQIAECPTGRSFPMIGVALTLGFAH